MNKDTLKHLSKEDLIEIITSDKTWKRKAILKLNDIVSKRIDVIIDKQRECDLGTGEGRREYFKLEEEYKKWSNIQDKL